MGLTTEEIRIALQIALLGEIYREIKAIVFGYDEEDKIFTLRYYLEKEPTDDDFESVSEVMTEFISHFKHSEFQDLKEECKYSNLPNSQLEPLSGFVYSRRENSLT